MITVVFGVKVTDEAAGAAVGLPAGAPLGAAVVRLGAARAQPIVNKVTNSKLGVTLHAAMLDVVAAATCFQLCFINRSGQARSYADDLRPARMQGRDDACGLADSSISCSVPNILP